ncbi:MAG: DUF1402 family protein [Verrucomicrobiales bacterium]|nr:DUF1402 family protein [Verrucomicrobiales bacterium]
MKIVPFVTSYGLLSFLVASSIGSVHAANVEGREISRENMREIRSDQFYPRTEKDFNTVFYKKHFTSKEEESDLLAYLVEMSEIYDVSSLAVFGAIMGEHSMNQRSTLKQVGESGINLLGKKFGKSGENFVNNLNVKFRGAHGDASFGPGQVQPFIATAMQSEIERIRPDATEDEMDKYCWKGSINIICAYMNYAANRYDSEGFNIRDDAPLLVTLFNIGERRMSFALRAAETRALVDSGERKGPWLNYFGYWIQRNIKTLESKMQPATKAMR